MVEKSRDRGRSASPASATLIVSTRTTSEPPMVFSFSLCLETLLTYISSIFSPLIIILLHAFLHNLNFVYIIPLIKYVEYIRFTRFLTRDLGQIDSTAIHDRFFSLDRIGFVDRTVNQMLPFPRSWERWGEALSDVWCPCPTTGPPRTFLAASPRVPFPPRDFPHVIASHGCVHSPGTCLRSL